MSARADATLELRLARREDAGELWRLVRDTGVLDLNSPYCYLLACEELADTCVVARSGQALVGFVMAFRPPRRQDTVFVWQVGVDASQRGRGLGRQLLVSLLAQPACHEVAYLEATVTPANTASRALFRGLARSLETECCIQPHFDAGDFPEPGHEAEELFRIGPFPTSQRRATAQD